jgi:arylsulfatase
VDGKEIACGDIPVTAPYRLGQGAAMLVGADTGGTVTPDYKSPFHFTGVLKRVIVDIGGEHVEDYEAAMKVALAKQ